MLKRTITGAVILAVTLIFVILKQYSDLFFDAYVLIMSYASLIEVASAYKLSSKKVNLPLLLFIPAVMCLIVNLANSRYDAFIYQMLTAIIILIISLTCEIIVFARNRKHGTTEKKLYILNQSLFEVTKNTMMVFAYPLLPLTFIFVLNHMPYDVGYIGIILAFAISMLTDTCAYLFGRAFGKHKFIPEVSPKKTIEGVVGGFVGGLVGGMGCFLVFKYTSLFNLLALGPTMPVIIIIFIVVSLVGSYINQLGDLIASAFKRKGGIKDFSNIFPGHGGFMDRIDGLMFTSTFIYIIFALFLV